MLVILTDAKLVMFATGCLLVESYSSESLISNSALPLSLNSFQLMHAQNWKLRPQNQNLVCSVFRQIQHLLSIKNKFELAKELFKLGIESSEDENTKYL